MIGTAGVAGVPRLAFSAASLAARRLASADSATRIRHSAVASCRLAYDMARQTSGQMPGGLPVPLWRRTTLSPKVSNSGSRSGSKSPLEAGSPGMARSPSLTVDFCCVFVFVRFRSPPSSGAPPALCGDAPDDPPLVIGRGLEDSA